MIVKYCVVILFLVYVTNCEEGYLPPYITPCDYNSPDLVDCVRKQVEIALPEFAKGIPELDIPPTEPLHLKKIQIDGNGLKLVFNDAVLHGYSKGKLTDLKVELGKREESFTIGLKFDLKLTAQYLIDGRILVVPIQGNGDAIIEARGFEITISNKLVHYKDASGEHVKLATPTYKYTIERTIFDLKNLFNGNKELADTTLQFANENWQQLMDELSPPVVQQIVKKFVKTINKFFSKVTIARAIKGYPTDD